jgi:hypothetical protein
VDELRVDTTLPDAARDQLRVLPAEVDDQDRAILGLRLAPLEREDLGVQCPVQ